MIKIDKNIKGLIFDLDGTLADTMELHYEAWKRCEKIFNFEFTNEEFYLWAGSPARNIAKKLNDKKGYNLDPLLIEKTKMEQYLQLIKESANSHSELVKPIKPVYDVVLKYKNRLPMAIGTGNLKNIATMTLKAINLENYFDVIVSSEDVKNYKPHPETFLKCAQLMNIDPKECLVFEDGDFGVEAAKKADMSVIDIRNII